MDKTMKGFIIKIVSIMVSYIFALIGPAYAYFINGIRTTTIEARIPFIEPNGNAEFMVNFLLQAIIGLHGIPNAIEFPIDSNSITNDLIHLLSGFIGYIVIECLMSILENTVTITPRLIENDLKHTIQLYEGKSITELELHMSIGNIVKQSNDADK